jgi:predicted nucleic acid-binding Zn ribbon protein
MTDLTSYDAFVDGQGYTWLVATDQKRYARRIRPPWNPQGEETPRLVLIAKHPELMDRRHVVPTQEDPALFRNFAAMEPTPEKILEFVHRYGRLWNEERERFEEWEFEIRTMRFLIELWDAMRAGKRTGIIEEHFKADKKGDVDYPFCDTVLQYAPWVWKRQRISEHSGEGVSVTTGDSGGGFQGTPQRAAQSYVVQAINRRLTVLGAQTMLDWPDGKYQLVTVPHNLLGALWFQFAASISGKKSYRACEVCGRAMEMSPDVNRADRRYCSDACRSRALRRRQKQAAQMRAAGKTLREIAKATGSDMATIKKWLRED